MTRSDNLDSFHLKVLCILLAEKSVSKAALQLNLPQPAVSRALKRLRKLLKDPLLVRGRTGMVLTERAMALSSTALSAHELLENLITDPQQFEPGVTSRTFSVGAPDFLSTMFLSGLASLFRTEAPSARLIVRPLTQNFDFEAELADGELDIVISNWPCPPENLHMSILLEDDIVVLMCKNNPLGRKKLTVEQYLSAPHIVPTPYSLNKMGVVETHLYKLGVERNSHVLIPYFNVVPQMLVNTDMIFTTSRHFAAYFARFLPLSIVTPPIDFPQMAFYQLWHERNHESLSHRWFRGLIKKASAQFLANVT